MLPQSWVCLLVCVKPTDCSGQKTGGKDLLLLMASREEMPRIFPRRWCVSQSSKVGTFQQQHMLCSQGLSRGEFRFKWGRGGQSPISSWLKSWGSTSFCPPTWLGALVPVELRHIITWLRRGGTRTVLYHWAVWLRRTTGSTIPWFPYNHGSLRLFRANTEARLRSESGIGPDEFLMSRESVPRPLSGAPVLSAYTSFLMCEAQKALLWQKGVAAGCVCGVPSKRWAAHAHKTQTPQGFRQQCLKIVSWKSITDLALDLLLIGWWWDNNALGVSITNLSLIQPVWALWAYGP